MHSITFYGKLKNYGVEIQSIPSQDSVKDLKMMILQRLPGLENEPFFLASEKGILKETDSLSGTESISIMPPFSGG